MIKAPQLKTERLLLRDINRQDVSFIVKWRSNPQVYRFFVSPHVISVDEHLQWYHSQYIFDKNRFDWMACMVEGTPVGIFGVKRGQENDREAEVSYLLAPEQYGKGYATEAVEELLRFCRDDWKCQFVNAEIHRKNHNSIKLVEKLGFKYESTNGTFNWYKRIL